MKCITAKKTKWSVVVSTKIMALMKAASVDSLGNISYSEILFEKRTILLSLMLTGGYK